MTNEKIIREPLFHITKKDVLPAKKVVLIYLIAVVVAMVLSALVCTIFVGANPLKVIAEMFNGNFGTEKRIWLLLQDTSLLLLVGLALLPAFKMKFWNLGGNGQILMGCLACIACMKYLGGTMPDAVVWIFMIIASLAAGAIWAVIPAIFKAKWNTNESLFTLMMNYIAAGLVMVAISEWVPTGSGVLSPIRYAHLPVIGNEYVLTILCAVVVVVLMFFYLKKSKHGFEVSLVGESQNTAKYVGLSVKKVVIRTLVLSGAICGLVGLLLGGGINYTMNRNSANNMGFTAIMVVWFAKCDPLMMIVSSFGITFLSKGMSQVKTFYGLNNDAITNLVVGLVYFIIIACEFFIVYKISLRKKKKETVSDFIENGEDKVKKGVDEQ